MILALVESLKRRFHGMLCRIRLQGPATSSSSESDNMAGFGEDLYVIASALDPCYGFLWLDEDHPGDAETKAQLKDCTTGNSRNFL